MTSEVNRGGNWVDWLERRYSTAWCVSCEANGIFNLMLAPSYLLLLCPLGRTWGATAVTDVNFFPLDRKFIVIAATCWEELLLTPSIAPEPEVLDDELAGSVVEPFTVAFVDEAVVEDPSEFVQPEPPHSLGGAHAPCVAHPDPLKHLTNVPQVEEIVAP